jgi:hypothetical protein
LLIALAYVNRLPINQNDVQERNQQVMMMSKIYASAQQVIVWLGIEKVKIPRLLV